MPTTGRSAFADPIDASLAKRAPHGPFQNAIDRAASRDARRNRTNSPPSATPENVRAESERKTVAYSHASACASTPRSIVPTSHITACCQPKYPPSADVPSDAPNITRIARLNQFEPCRRSYSISSPRASWCSRIAVCRSSTTYPSAMTRRRRMIPGMKLTMASGTHGTKKVHATLLAYTNDTPAMEPMPSTAMRAGSSRSP